jgi:hypothetical protein
LLSVLVRDWWTDDAAAAAAVVFIDTSSMDE